MAKGIKLRQKKTNRRKILESFAKISAGAFFILSACKTQSGKKENQRSKAPQEIDDKDRNINDGENLGENSDKSTSSKDKACEAPDIDLSQFDTVGENLSPQLFIYGDKQSALLIVSLPKYQHTGILESLIVMLLPSRRVLSLRAILKSDIKSNFQLRPIVFENLKLLGDTKVALIFKVSCDTCTGNYSYQKYEIPEKISFVSEFKGKDAYGAKPNTAIDNYYGNFYNSYQANLKFTLDPDKVPGRLGSYAKIRDNDELDEISLKNFYVTDLTGKVLSEPGEDFNDFFEHPEFFCYKAANNGEFYIRTLIRVY